MKTEALYKEVIGGVQFGFVDGYLHATGRKELTKEKLARAKTDAAYGAEVLAGFALAEGLTGERTDKPKERSVGE